MRSMVERETPPTHGVSLSDPAPPGHLSLRERSIAVRGGAILSETSLELEAAARSKGRAG